VFFFALVGYNLIFCLWQTVLYVYWNQFLIFLQENDDTVTGERVLSEGEGDCIKTETEDCIQLVRTVKSEGEVSVVCWCVLW
jgi:hypothetical protein